jgi:hypothetical protein
MVTTLILKSSIPKAPLYEIPLMASAKCVVIFCEGVPSLNFAKQAIGEEETITRKFRNNGKKDVHFSMINQNPSLKITPPRGVLKASQSVRISFTFKPVDESIQNKDVIFQPDCSQPVVLKMLGSGGFVKCSLSKYRRFDFGRCMIGKETVSYLPVVNEGTCFLNLTKFDIVEDNGAFSKHASWPTER